MRRALSLIAAAALLAFASSTNAAASLRLRGAKVVRVRGVAGTPYQLASDGAGWRVELAELPAGGTSAELIDVTPGTPARTLSVPLDGATLRLDEFRFVAGHVYRLQLRKAGAAVAVGLVYLAPHADPAAPRRPSSNRVDFAEGERPAADAADLPAAQPKGRL
jgi:hypothetical protein